ncbi:hypothetical protein ONZ45_g8532 [Pleurotus djamor]|nr:hypothetical protein ONZ45_g8532 [Pleurotus djamor]
MWSFVSPLESGEWVNESLRRSKTTGIILDIDFNRLMKLQSTGTGTSGMESPSASTSMPKLLEFQRLVIAETHRFEEFYIHFPRSAPQPQPSISRLHLPSPSTFISHFFPPHPHTPLPTPRLRTLEIQNPDPYINDRGETCQPLMVLPSFWVELHSLRRMRLINVLPTASSFAITLTPTPTYTPLPSLTHIHIDTTEETNHLSITWVAQFLQHAPMLEDIDISRICSTHPNTTTPIPISHHQNKNKNKNQNQTILTPIPLPHLHKLALGFHDFKDSILLPSLHMPPHADVAIDVVITNEAEGDVNFPHLRRFMRAYFADAVSLNVTAYEATGGLEVRLDVESTFNVESTYTFNDDPNPNPNLNLNPNPNDNHSNSQYQSRSNKFQLHIHSSASKEDIRNLLKAHALPLDKIHSFTLEGPTNQRRAAKWSSSSSSSHLNSNSNGSVLPLLIHLKHITVERMSVLRFLARPNPDIFIVDEEYQFTNRELETIEVKPNLSDASWDYERLAGLLKERHEHGCTVRKVILPRMSWYESIFQDVDVKSGGYTEVEWVDVEVDDTEEDEEEDGDSEEDEEDDSSTDQGSEWDD